MFIITVRLEVLSDLAARVTIHLLMMCNFCRANRMMLVLLTGR